MAKRTEAEVVRETFKAVEAGHAKDRSETTYVILANTLGDDRFKQVARITVPSRTHMDTVYRRAFTAMANGTTVTDVEIMAVPEKYAKRKRVRYESDPRVVIEDA